MGQSRSGPCRRQAQIPASPSSLDERAPTGTFRHPGCDGCAQAPHVTPCLLCCPRRGLIKIPYKLPPKSNGLRHCSSSLSRRSPGFLKAMRMSRSEEHTSELQSLMRISYAVFCLKKKTTKRKRVTKYVDTIQ